MKAAFALVIIYVGIFLVVVQGASRTPVQASGQEVAPTLEVTANSAIDPAKEVDIRSLMELVGAKDAVAEATTRVAEQYRESLFASVPDNPSGQSFISTFSERYQAKVDPEGVTDQLVNIYDRHFTGDEVKGLLQFYGSPLGQKFAAEMPKVNAEIQVGTRRRSLLAARDVLQDLRKEFPVVGAQAKLSKQHLGQQGASQPVRDARPIPELQPARQMQSLP
ncbi:MAG: hypothetical protein NVS9B4_21500 [Candidatus Acidiferrum sp.]